jgi:predicted dehydrogenase
MVPKLYKFNKTEEMMMNTAMNPLRIGVIGCGAIAQLSHIPYIADDERFELVALADMNESLLNEVADRYKIAHRYVDYKDVYARDDIDAVIICHSGSHYETILAAIDAEKHIFTEKPVAWNLRQVEEIAETVANYDKIVQVGYHKLYDPAFPYAKEQVGNMQDLGFVRITVLHPTNELGLSPHRIRRGNGTIVEGHVDPGSWTYQVHMQREAFAGGALTPLVDEALQERKNNPHLRLAYGHLTLSIIHQIYMMYGFLGEPEGVVSAETWREGMSIHILVAYPGDLRCSLDWHFLSHLKDYREEYNFYGNFDRVTLRFPSPYFLHFPSPVIIQGCQGELAWEKKVIVSYEEAFHNELRAFYDNVQNNKEPKTTVSDALKHIRFVYQVIDAL